MHKGPIRSWWLIQFDVIVSNKAKGRTIQPSVPYHNCFFQKLHFDIHFIISSQKYTYIVNIYCVKIFYLAISCVLSNFGGGGGGEGVSFSPSHCNFYISSYIRIFITVSFHFLQTLPWKRSISLPVNLELRLWKSLVQLMPKTNLKMQVFYQLNNPIKLLLRIRFNQLFKIFSIILNLLQLSFNILINQDLFSLKNLVKSKLLLLS